MLCLWLGLCLSLHLLGPPCDWEGCQLLSCRSIIFRVLSLSVCKQVLSWAPFSNSTRSNSVIDSHSTLLHSVRVFTCELYYHCALLGLLSLQSLVTVFSLAPKPTFSLFLVVVFTKVAAHFWYQFLQCSNHWLFEMKNLYFLLTKVSGLSVSSGSAPDYGPTLDPSHGTQAGGAALPTREEHRHRKAAQLPLLLRLCSHVCTSHLFPSAGHMCPMGIPKSVIHGCLFFHL
jgi:hypothetical protein